MSQVQSCQFDTILRIMIKCNKSWRVAIVEDFGWCMICWWLLSPLQFREYIDGTCEKGDVIVDIMNARQPRETPVWEQSVTGAWDDIHLIAQEQKVTSTSWIQNV